MRKSWAKPFEDCYEPCPVSGCWLWTQALKGDGYGHKHYEGKYQSAHRISWKLNRGPIPDGMFVLHHCDVMRCVNPDHLFLGTHEDNMRDAHEKGRGAFRATCKYGHPLTEGNLYHFSNGRRQCKQCTMRRDSEYRTRKKAEITA